MTKPRAKTAYLAPEGYEKQLMGEIKGIIQQYGRLFLTDRPPQVSFWAQNIWLDPFVAAFETISEAATILKDRQRNWALYPFAEHRRAALIKEKLPYLSEKLIIFPAQIPAAPLGSWTLLDKNTLLASPVCSSPYGNGEVRFQECKEGPPSRAYLKLWEALLYAGSMPGREERGLEIGASPGGWTWVLANLGADILCIDRAPLAPEVAAMPGVHFKTGNAFAITPSTSEPFKWIFSDVACYPEKLLEWVQLWLNSGQCKNFICTLKFQGDDDYHSAQAFAKIPGSRVMHLSHNKHELTWICIQDSQDQGTRLK